jgi:hypothetical protein
MPELKAKQDWYPLTAESRKSPKPGAGCLQVLASDLVEAESAGRARRSRWDGRQKPKRPRGVEAAAVRLDGRERVAPVFAPSD